MNNPNYNPQKNYNGNYNGGPRPNNYGGYPNPNNPNNPNNNEDKNTGLIVAVSVLSVVVAIGIIFTVLVATGAISFSKNEEPKEDTAVVQTQDTDTSTNTQNNSDTVKQPSVNPVDTQPKAVPVGKTMYVGNCKQSITLRTGPDGSYGEIMQIPLGESIYVVEYTNDSFARVRYNGSEGYADRSCIVSERPQVYTYDESKAINLVENSLYAFVNGVTNNSDSYVYVYFKGSEAEKERKTVKEIASTVEREEILRVNCHSVKRASATTVTVTRESDIRVYYKDGSVKDISEKYIYTVDITSSDYKIVGLKQA